MSLPGEGGLAGVDVEVGMNAVGQIPVVKVVSALSGELVRMASHVSGATLGQ